jgi:hypothetical protein
VGIDVIHIISAPPLDNLPGIPIYRISNDIHWASYTNKRMQMVRRERDRAVVSILRHSAALNVGSSARSAFARRLADYEEKFAALRKKRARRAA